MVAAGAGVQKCQQPPGDLLFHTVLLFPAPDAEAVAVSSYSTVTLAAVGAVCVALRSPKSSTITSANETLSPGPIVLLSDLKYIYTRPPEAAL